MPDRDTTVIRGSYKAFIDSPAGADFLAQCKELETQFLTQALKQTDPDIQLRYLNQMGGFTVLRDYVVRMADPNSIVPREGSKGTLASPKGMDKPKR